MNIRKTNWLILIACITIIIFTLLWMFNIIPINAKILQIEIVVIFLIEVIEKKVNKTKFLEEIEKNK